MKTLKRTWADVSMDDLEHNYNAIMGHIPSGCRFLGVIKADAYGHGAVPVSQALTDLGAAYLAVSNLEEAIQIRRAGIRTPILILGYTPPEYADSMVFMDITQEVHSLEYAEALECVGCEISYFDLPKEKRFVPDDRFLEAIQPGMDICFFCNPNNPTGYLYTRKEMNRIRDMVKKYDLFLFSDEVYREFIYTGSPYISACHLEGIEQNVVLIDSVSKRYSECGIRIGALITKNKTLRNAVMKFCQARLSPPLIGQIIAEASIDAPRSYSTEVYEEYIERRKCLIDGLNRIPGVYSPIPMGAFYTVARLPVDDSDKFCAWCLSDFEYEGETVMMAPASGFYSDPECGRNEVRIAYVLKQEDLERAMDLLALGIQKYNETHK